MEHNDVLTAEITVCGNAMAVFQQNFMGWVIWGTIHKPREHMFILDVATTAERARELLMEHATFNETQEAMWAAGRIIFLQDFKKFAQARGAVFRW